MNNNSTQQDNKEIDLLQVSNYIKKGIGNTLKIIPITINFIKKNLFILIALLLIGYTAGYFYNKYNKKYESNIIVTPNFNTVNYLNERVKLLNSKIQQNDTVFLNKIGINAIQKVYKIEVTPITDLYKFLNQDDKNYEIFKILSENADAKKVMEDTSTSKNFANHLITISSINKIDEKTYENIIKYLNASKFYEVARVEILNNLENKISLNDTSIYQINQILNKAGSPSNTSTTIAVNDQSQLNDLIKEKRDLIQENDDLKVHKYSLKYIITPIDFSPNIEAISNFKGKYQLIFPIILIGLFVAIVLIRKIK